MNIAVLSDIHGNLEAFVSVLNDMYSENIDSIINLGDTVGYGAEPDKCLDILMFFCGEKVALPGEMSDSVNRYKGKCTTAVAGNHDWGVIGKLPEGWFNQTALKALKWTEKTLSIRHINFLKSLPIIDKHNNILTVHSSPIHPEEFYYITNSSHAYKALMSSGEQIVLVGHSHIPGIFVLRGENISNGVLYEHQIKGDERLLVNVGSVGQPRDGDPRASYAIFNTDNKTIKITRVDYDIDTASSKIKDAGIPVRYAERLKWGF